MMEEIAKVEKKNAVQVKQDIADVSTALTQIHHDVEEHTSKQRLFRTEVVSKHIINPVDEQPHACEISRQLV